MLCVNRLFYSFVVLLAAFASESTPAHAQIDLHAHLHMKPGMGAFLQGHFHEPPRVNHWSEKIYTKVSATSLASMNNETRPKLIVISLYSHPYLSYSFERDGFQFDRKKNVRHGIEKEYQEFSKFVQEHSDQFGIAKNALEARKILAAGKTVIVLSLEGAWGTLNSAEDFHLWIEKRGLAIVTPVHLTPDTLGGNALMSTLVSLANSTQDFLKSVWVSRGSCLKTFCKSEEGFSEKGKQTVDELMKKNVWIDLAHANELEVIDLVQRHEKGIANSGPLPLLVTHTQLREFFPVERGLGSLEINYIRKHEGIIGIIPSQYMMPAAMKHAHEEAISSHPEEKNAPSAASGLTCISGLDVFKKTVAYAIASLGAPERVTLASDINAPLDGLSPGCGEVVSQEQLKKPASNLNFEQIDLHRRGYYTYSQWNTLTHFVSPERVNTKSGTKWPDQSLEHFLMLWEKIRPSKPLL